MLPSGRKDLHQKGQSTTAGAYRVFGDSGTPETGPGLVSQFWGLDSDRILKLVLREIILSQDQEIQMPPGGRRPIGHRLQQVLPFGRIIDLGEFLRQIQVIGVPAASARKFTLAYCTQNTVA